MIPFSAGGGTDIQGRLLGKKFNESMKQNFLIDNRPGAAGLIGAELVAKLNAEIVQALKAPEIRDFILKEGGEPVGSTPEALAAQFRKEVDKYARVIKAGNVTAD